MMDVQAQKLSKESHPQKYYLKLICRYLYYMGVGDCWYEKTERSRTHRILYGIWAVLLNGYIIMNTFNELLANMRTDLIVKEEIDLMQFSVAHPCLCGKFILLIFQKERVRILFKRMMEGTRSVYYSAELDKASVKKAIFYVVMISGVTYPVIFLAVLDGTRAYFVSGIPIRTEVVFFPTRFDSGLFVNFLRFLVEIHWWCIVTVMLLVDALCVFALTFLEFKFKLVRMYYAELREKTINDSEIKNKSILDKEFQKDFKIGVMLHEDALWCAGNVQYALGNLYSLQVLEAIALLVMCLLRLVSNDRNLFALLSILAYIACLFALTWAYFIAAGDITYQASEVSTSIFHCGWELLPPSRSLCAMAVVAIQRSQVPVNMTAFGVIILDHSNYISVMRSAYSFFAVMY